MKRLHPIHDDPSASNIPYAPVYSCRDRQAPSQTALRLGTVGALDGATGTSIYRLRAKTRLYHNSTVVLEYRWVFGNG